MGGLRWRTGDRRNVEDRRFEDPPGEPEIADVVDGVSRMTERQILVDELVRDEDRRLKPYVDIFGNITIGVGRNLTGKGLTYAETDMLLENDIDEVIRDLSTFPWYLALDPVRQRALINMRFQLGPSGFRKFKATIAAIAAGDYRKAGDQMRASLWAKQVRTRATRLIRMMQTGAV